MSLTHLFIFVGFTILISLLSKTRGREWLLLTVSVLSIYWLQPPTPIRHLDFWLPTFTLAIIAVIYAASRSVTSNYNHRSDLITGVVIVLLVLMIAVSRYLGPLCCITPTAPPQLWIVFIGMLIVVILWGLGRWIFSKETGGLNVLIFLLLGIFLLQKNDSLATMTSAAFRSLTGQSIKLATSQDIPWIGFSYIAFRLIHVLRDRITGRLPESNLRELVTYIIFFPTITAGPIDRIQRFVGDLRAEFSLRSPQVIRGGRRILIGMLKKFVLADNLAYFALDAQNAAQTYSTGWTWVMLYAYSFRIYFDFSGYTDIAIGLGQFAGFTLPENFIRSYLQTNLTTFWNNWHMTLTQWFRAYFFNPITRAMRSSKYRLPMWVIILFGQLSTMVLIGLWHGITWNFVIWGIWHGVGLFVHNRWADFTRTRFKIEGESIGFQKLITGFNIFLTFQYVSLGWLWFALPSPELSLQVLRNLFGI
jgi:D-alanyl-lipoteichoic acid acyltransferase DltB (MBOAT superfamily)